MKRFIVICVALVALLATNSSGTNYHQSDQLQTFSVHQIDMPALTANVPDFELPQVIRTATPVQVPEIITVSMKVVLTGYHDPDYGLCSIRSYALNNRKTEQSKITGLLFKPKLE